VKIRLARTRLESTIATSTSPSTCGGRSLPITGPADDRLNELIARFAARPLDSRARCGEGTHEGPGQNRIALDTSPHQEHDKRPHDTRQWRFAPT